MTVEFSLRNACIPASGIQLTDIYDRRYRREGYYWGLKPSSNCSRVLEIIPPSVNTRLLDVGCGEGRDAVFFAGKGYDVTAFDLSPVGVEKTLKLAETRGVSLNAFVADIREFRLETPFDIVFSTGVLQYLSCEIRGEILDNYQAFTSAGGVNALSVFVSKPFIPPAPDAEESAFEWNTGELLGHYADWLIEYTSEDIFDCMSGGVPHRHAISRVIARKVSR